MARSGSIAAAKPEKPANARLCADDRRKAILAAAREVFLDRGYASASIDAVVERAGGSKATVYQLFGNKEGLLAALVTQGAESLADLVSHLPLDGKLEESLRAFGGSYLRFILLPERLALFRLVIGESGRNPELGDVFYRTGPQRIGRWLADFFREIAGRGLISTTDPERIAYQFIHAMRGDIHMQVLMNPTRAPTDRELEAHVDFVVRTFLDGCRAR